MALPLQRLKRRLKKDGLLPYLISDLINIQYLTGFTGSYATLVIDEKSSFFISDSRYEEYARSILPGSVEFVLQKSDPLDILRNELKSRSRKELYLEEHSITLSSFRQMKKKLRGIKVIPAGDVVNELRMIKDEHEIEIIRRAAAITDRCVDHLVQTVKPGLTEWDVAVEIECFYRKNGCRRSSFDAIVASGAGSSMPHYETSMEKKIRTGDPLLIDMGCHYKGYNSDLTRTFFVGTIDPLIEKIYNIVKRAQEAALAAVKPGITTGKLDAAARNIIAEEGYGIYFGHSLGHGLGLEVHELPAVKAGERKLKKNMVITVEPGIYLPGRGGVRIEDMVLVTSRGCEVLTRSSKDIIVL